MNVLKRMRKITVLLLAVFVVLFIPFVAFATEDTHTVTYIADEEVVSTQEVAHGDNAVAPEIPGKFGYTQIAPQWSHDGKHITQDITIEAIYTLNEYVVTYKVEGVAYKRLSYLHGEQVIMIPVPEKAGYTAAWDTIIDVLTDDITVNAVYTEITVPDTVPTTSQQLDNEDNNESDTWMIILLCAAVVLLALLILLLIRKKKNGKKANA